MVAYPDLKPCPHDDPAECPDEGDHNPNGDHYGCECSECIEFYRGLK
jgi:hypothetical protein